MPAQKERVASLVLMAAGQFAVLAIRPLNYNKTQRVTDAHLANLLEMHSENPFTVDVTRMAVNVLTASDAMH